MDVSKKTEAADIIDAISITRNALAIGWFLGADKSLNGHKR
jgi:hypothetical protein